MNEENNQATALAQTSKERLESYLKPMSLAEAEQVMAWADSYSRLPKLLDIYPKMERADWLTLFGREWSGFDNAGQMIADGELQDCDHLHGADGPLMQMMDDDEQTSFAALPDEVTVYRGCYELNKWGASWTLDRDVAERFPFLNRYRMEGERPLLVKARIKKTQITALKLDRGESEVICLWSKPKHISTSTARNKPRD